MALKFLNKKGWHTGSLRNIENVWKVKQKHEAEQKKLEELRKQIQEEREHNEFRHLQEKVDPRSVISLSRFNSIQFLIFNSLGFSFFISDCGCCPMKMVVAAGTILPHLH